MLQGRLEVLEIVKDEAVYQGGRVALADKGGTAIPYHEEDPYIRKEFEDHLKSENVPTRMDPKFYVKPDGYPD